MGGGWNDLHRRFCIAFRLELPNVHLIFLKYVRRLVLDVIFPQQRSMPHLFLNSDERVVLVHDTFFDVWQKNLVGTIVKLSQLWQRAARLSRGYLSARRVYQASLVGVVRYNLGVCSIRTLVLILC